MLETAVVEGEKSTFVGNQYPKQILDLDVKIDEEDNSLIEQSMNLAISIPSIHLDHFHEDTIELDDHQFRSRMCPRLFAYFKLISFCHFLVLISFISIFCMFIFLEV